MSGEKIPVLVYRNDFVDDDPNGQVADDYNNNASSTKDLVTKVNDDGEDIVRYGLATGVNTYVVVITDIELNADKTKIVLEIPNTNTAASSIKVNNGTSDLATLDLKKYNAAGKADVVANELIAGTRIIFMYDGTDAVILSNPGLVEKQLNLPKQLGGGLLINGNFDIWQRGDILSSFSLYTADRWKLSASAGSVTGQKIVTDGSEPFNALNYLRVSATIGFSALLQSLENAGVFLKNKKSAFTFWVKADKVVSANTLLRNDTQAANYQVVGYNITTEWQKITINFNAQSGWDSTDVGVAYLFSFVSDPTAIIDLAQVKFEVGDIATDFIPKTYAEELMDCEWYFERLKGNIASSYFGASYQAVNASNSFGDVIISPKRTSSPTVTHSGAFKMRRSTTDVSVTAIVLGDLVNKNLTLVITAAGIVQDNYYALQGDSDINAYIDIDDEL